MKLKVGKYYKHKDGYYLSIVSEADTTMWGRVLLGESPEDPYGLIPVAIEEQSNDEWTEVIQEEWSKQFIKSDDTDSK